MDDRPGIEEIQLQGGIANAGSVTSQGPHVLGPSNPHTPSIHRFLTVVHDAGFDGASVPIGVDGDGRERLVFIDGDVAVPPYPEWAQSDAALTSTAELIRRFHEAAATFDPAGCTWSDEMTDPVGGPIVCHNDVCLENVVFRDGTAVGLVDFDFAAPGRAVYDLVQFARMCVPIDDEVNAGRLGWARADLPGRLRRVADAYGLDAAGRLDLVGALDDSIRRGGEFVQRRVEAGHTNFGAMWNEMGGMERFDRRRRWWAAQRQSFVMACA